MQVETIQIMALVGVTYLLLAIMGLIAAFIVWYAIDENYNPTDYYTGGFWTKLRKDNNIVVFILLSIIYAVIALFFTPLASVLLFANHLNKRIW